MTVRLQSRPARNSVPIHLATFAEWARPSKTLAAPTPLVCRHRLQRAKPAGHALVAGADGALAGVWAGVTDIADLWLLAALPKALPPALSPGPPGE
ncbi:MAG: hypothetical protein U1F67_21265 [Rubrivivax sp.]